MLMIITCPAATAAIAAKRQHVSDLFFLIIIARTSSCCERACRMHSLIPTAAAVVARLFQPHSSLCRLCRRTPEKLPDAGGDHAVMLNSQMG
jgi:hypothetical protein